MIQFLFINRIFFFVAFCFLHSTHCSIESCDWLDFPTGSYICSEKTCYTYPPVTISFHEKFSCWLKMTCVYEDEKKPVYSDTTKKYMHSFLILISERDFGNSCIIKSNCDHTCNNGWRVSMQQKNDSIEPFFVKLVECTWPLKTVFSERKLRFSRVYRVEFEMDDEILPEKVTLIFENGYRKACITLNCSW